MIIVLFKMINGTLIYIFEMNWTFNITIDYLIGSTHINKNLQNTETTKYNAIIIYLFYNVFWTMQQRKITADQI